VLGLCVLGQGLGPNGGSGLSDGPAEFDLNAAWIRKAGADHAAFLEGLGTRLHEALPDRVTIDWRREGLFSTNRRVARLSVAFDSETLSLERSGNTIVAQRAKVVRGVRIHSEQVSVAVWLADLDRHVGELALDVRSVSAVLHDFLMS
jgi:hypothetical protein